MEECNCKKAKLAREEMYKARREVCNALERIEDAMALARNACILANDAMKAAEKDCPVCGKETEEHNNAEGMADQDAEAEAAAAAAQAECEAAANDQAMYEAQQAADEAYHHNQGGPDGY